MLTFSIQEIEAFANQHQDETFYAFAIDADLLCFNSEERFTVTLEKYRKDWEHNSRHIDCWQDLTEEELKYARIIMKVEGIEGDPSPEQKADYLIGQNEFNKSIRDKGNPYYQEDEISDLKFNTGDWEYQGFSCLETSRGFDVRAYDNHYDMSPSQQKKSPYGKAMDLLLEDLKNSNTFNRIRKTKDFQIIRVEHNY